MAKTVNKETHFNAKPGFIDIEFVVVAKVKEEVVDKNGEIKTVTSVLQSEPIHDTDRLKPDMFSVSKKSYEKAKKNNEQPQGCSAFTGFGTTLYREDGSESGHTFAITCMSPADEVQITPRNLNFKAAQSVFGNITEDDEAPL